MENTEEKPKKIFTPFSIISLIFFFAAIINSFYFFYIKKDFNFIVESPCDPNLEQCFMRDCTNPDNCPPNELATFKRYSLKAADFKYCKDEDCTFACQNKQIQCLPIECKESLEMGESCSAIPIPNPIPTPVISENKNQ